jgi:hypothetical protein
VCFPVVLFQESIEAHRILLQHHLTLPQCILVIVMVTVMVTVMVMVMVTVLVLVIASSSSIISLIRNASCVMVML